MTRRAAVPGGDPPELPLVLPSLPRPAVGVGHTSPSRPPSNGPPASSNGSRRSTQGVPHAHIDSQRPTLPNSGAFTDDEAPTLNREPEIPALGAATRGLEAAPPLEPVVAPPNHAEAGPPPEVPTFPVPVAPQKPPLAPPSSPANAVQSQDPPSAANQAYELAELRPSPAPRSGRRRLLTLLAATGFAGALAAGGALYPERYQQAWGAARAGVSAWSTTAEQDSSRKHAAPGAAAAPSAGEAAVKAPAPSGASALSDTKLPKSGDETATEPAADSAIPWSDGTSSDPSRCLPEPPESATDSEDLVASQRLQASGRRRLIQGDVAGSVAAFCKAAALNRHNSTLAFQLARAALLNRDGVTAARWAERALTLTPPDQRAREYLADALAWQGKVEAARSEWFRIHKVSPSDKMLSNMRRGALLEARAAQKRGTFPQAERFLRRALSFDTESAETTTQLAHVVLQQGHTQAAARWIQRALALNDDDSQRRLLAGDIQQKLNNPTAAAKHYQRALELEPHNATAKLRVEQHLE